MSLAWLQATEATRLFVRRRSEPGPPTGSLASLSDAPPLKSGRSSLTGAPGAPGAPSSAEAGSECGGDTARGLAMGFLWLSSP